VPEKLKINTEIEVHSSVDSLPENYRELIHKAKLASQKAYAPYSGFLVGAAVLLENGETISGNNQENAAYPSGLCAERVALFYASSQYPDVKITAIAVTARSFNRTVTEPVPPCGACRQVIAEYENKFQQNVKIIMTGESGKIYISESIANLLPLSFTSQNLQL
jgi:cytidine deaminase